MIATVPPARVSRSRTIASPSPAPPEFRPRASSSLVKRSKTRSRSSGGMPWAVVADADHGLILINCGGHLHPG